MNANMKQLDATTAFSRSEKREQGKALRDKCPRSSQKEWNARAKSQDPIKLLEESDTDRIPGLIAEKYQRMAASPFAFFRGAAIIQARDLANARVSGITVHACGDCHLMNFGGFASPERTLIFDINDFDETFPGAWEWDIKRLGASLVLAARDLRFSRSVAGDTVRAAAASYRDRMSEFADMNVLDCWYAQVSIGALKEYFRNSPKLVARLEKSEEQARSRTSEAVTPKLTAIVNGQRKIKDNPPVLYHPHIDARELDKHKRNHFKQYRESVQTK
jgi:hypothetical protein